MTRRIPVPAFVLLSTLALAACKTPEERAQEYFESAMSLIAEGDEDRALIELRNVFQNDGFHLEARKTYADILRERGQMQEAYGQYLRLVEQYPDLAEVRLILAESAFSIGNWNEVERHGRAAIEIDPNVPRAKAIALALDYREAVLERATVRRSDIAAAAEQEIEAQPENLVLRQIVIDHLMEGPLPSDALPHLEVALELVPDSLRYNTLKLRLLAQAEDVEGVGAHLKSMVALFPENTEVKQSMIRWHLSQQDIDGAEAFLRAEAGDLTGETGPHLDVVRFMTQMRDRDAGRAELRALVAANEGTAQADLYTAFLATMDFEDGKTEEAIAALTEVLADAEPSDQTRNIMAMQARMYEATEQRDKARVLVDKALEEDPTNVDALKLRATWLIDADQPGDAIVALRTAQSQAPRDAQIMTLLAAAFERDGSTDLAGEQLSKAVEASGAGVDESLRYARFLAGQGRPAAAESVLRDARRASNNNPEILAALAELLLQNQRFDEVREIADMLRNSSLPSFQEAAERMDAAILLGQNQIDEGLEMLQAQADGSEGDLRALAVLVSTQVRAGQVNQARALLDQRLSEDPDSQPLRLLSANVNSLLGETEAAEAELRALIDEAPQAELPVRLLYGLLRREGRQEDASAVIDAGLEALPESRQLLWIKAGTLEQQDRFDDAIDIYERIYALNSSDVIAANNLASMLSVHRDDAESLERAFNIARRLRSLEPAAFKDTYGWIEYRRGNVQDALPYLEAGADGLPNDPLAQYHLAMAYADLGRTADAIERFQRMIELAEGRDLPQLSVANQRLAELTTDQ
ncbi:tetratricopeptide repeat protein [Primorskyibacter sp. S187A]|uniref:tetratricopeptide repeat protein n=1 Tax=Primorskyibacter sp. S187A TaxID=3415130 RepID=UPI003C7AFB1B